MSLIRSFQRRSKILLPALALFAAFQAVVLTSPEAARPAADGLTDLRGASAADLG